MKSSLDIRGSEDTVMVIFRGHRLDDVGCGLEADAPFESQHLQVGGPATGQPIWWVRIDSIGLTGAVLNA